MDSPSVSHSQSTPCAHSGQETCRDGELPVPGQSASDPGTAPEGSGPRAFWEHAGRVSGVLVQKVGRGALVSQARRGQALPCTEVFCLHRDSLVLKCMLEF